MTANRIDDFESWVRSVEKRVTRLERKPRTEGGGGGPATAHGALYQGVPFINGEAVANLPSNVPSHWYVVGGFTFESGEEVGIAVSVNGDVANIRAAVSDGDYDLVLAFVAPWFD